MRSRAVAARIRAVTRTILAAEARTPAATTTTRAAGTPTRAAIPTTPAAAETGKLVAGNLPRDHAQRVKAAAMDTAVRGTNVAKAETAAPTAAASASTTERFRVV